jgi:hypothetical protein
VNFRYDADFRQELGRILAQNRRAKGLEIPQAALRLKVDPFKLRRIEAGNEEVSQDDVVAIAFSYGINLVLVQLAFERKFLTRVTFAPPNRPNHLRTLDDRGSHQEEKGPSPQG